MSQHIMRMHTVPPLMGELSGGDSLSVNTFCGPTVLECLKVPTKRCVLLSINGESIALNAHQVKHLSVLFEELSQ